MFGRHTAPLGPLGTFADWLFLEAYMRRFLAVRNELIKSVAESDGADEYLRESELAPKSDREGS